MIKAEIKVGDSTYVLEFPEGKNLQDVHAYALSVATGHKVHNTGTEILDLNKKDYDHIRVWQEAPQLPHFPQVAPPKFKEPENPGLVKKGVEYLGQKLDLEVTTYADGDRVYMLPYKINGNPATSMLGTAALAQLCSEFAKRQGYQPCEVVLPHGNIYDDQEALAFVKDYAEETTEGRIQLLQDSDKTARGFNWPEEK